MGVSPLEPSALVKLMKLSICPREDTVALRNGTEAIALFAHSCMLSVGFRLLGFSEEDMIDGAITAENPGPLPMKWNQAQAHGFRYAHAQSSMEFILKINRLGSKTILLGVGLGDDKTAKLEIVTQDYTSLSFFPYKAETDSDLESIAECFTSINRMADLSLLVKINILQKLMPGLQKDGYQEENVNSPSAEVTTGFNRHNEHLEQPRRLEESEFVWPRRGDPLRLPRRPRQFPGDLEPPDFEDELEFFRQRELEPRGGLGSFPSIGDEDLNPFGIGPRSGLGNGPFVPGLGPRGGSGGGGMYPGPGHPIFGGPVIGPNGAGGGYDPSRPPGARIYPRHPGDASTRDQFSPGGFSYDDIV